MSYFDHKRTGRTPILLARTTREMAGAHLSRSRSQDGDRNIFDSDSREKREGFRADGDWRPAERPAVDPASIQARNAPNGRPSWTTILAKQDKALRSHWGPPVGNSLFNFGGRYTSCAACPKSMWGRGQFRSDDSVSQSLVWKPLHRQEFLACANQPISQSKSLPRSTWLQ